MARKRRDGDELSARHSPPAASPSPPPAPLGRPLRRRQGRRAVAPEQERATAAVPEQPVGAVASRAQKCKAQAAAVGARKSKAARCSASQTAPPPLDATMANTGEDAHNLLDTRLKTLRQGKESLVDMSDDKAASSIRTIVISNLESCMDEQFLYKCFARTGEVTGILLQRDETTNAPNTAFVEFSTHANAKEALDYTNGKPRPDYKGFFSLEMRWASTNLDRTVKGPHTVTYKSDESNTMTYKSDESSDSDTASTLESDSSDSD